MNLTRRELLRLAIAAGAVKALPVFTGCGDDGEGGSRLPEYHFEGEPGPATLFSHAVASGDPLEDAVVLWTRLSPDRPGPFDVFWEIARDEAFLRRIGAGWTTTAADRDFTVKLDAMGLEPGTTYYYRFRALGRTSPLGRTRTAPVGPFAHMRIGVASCSNYAGGYFHGYRHMAERGDLDLVLHLGDYIYEGGRAGVRAVEPPHEILTLDDYRTRYSLYRRDPDLQAAHSAYPFVTVWDDHETANDAWKDGAQNHGPDEGSWLERRTAAARAYSEWMPIRDSADGRIWRSFRFGDLIDLVMLDTRIWGRDQQSLAAAHDPSRTLLGFDQEEWLAEQLRASTARWRVIGNQVVMAPLYFTAPPEGQGARIANPDQWDGYVATRQRLFDVLHANRIDNVVVVTGDIHASGCANLTENPFDPALYDPASGDGSLGVELVTPGITSGSGIPAEIKDFLMAQNPHIKFMDLQLRGYVVLDVTPERATGTWVHLAAVEQIEPPAIVPAPTFAALAGSNRLVEETASA